MKSPSFMISKINLLGPAVFLTRNLNVGKKIVLIVALLLLPLISLTYLFIEQRQQQISSLEQKRVGVAYSVELRKLLEGLALYRGLVFSVTQGEAELTVRTDQQLRAVREAIHSMDEVDSRIGKELKISESWANLKDELTILDDETAASSSPRRFEKEAMIAGRHFDEYSKLINNIRLMMSRVSDNSTLTLDANLDSFYLMSLMVDELLHVADAVQTLRGLSSTMAAPTNKVRGGADYLTTLLALIEEHQGHVAVALQKVIQQNPHLGDRLNKLREDMNDHIYTFTQTLRPQDSNLRPIEKFELGSAAVQSVFRLYDDIAIALDISLKKQAAGLTADRNCAAAIIAICLLLTFYLCAGVYSSVVNRIQALVKATGKIAEGDHKYRVNILGRDEFSLVAAGFNCMADRLEEKRLLEEQLQQAQKHEDVARMANAAKSTFLATMSHEIRTPMNGVIGCLDLLGRTHLMPDQQELLETMHESSFTLLRVIDDILDYSKIEAGQLELECEPMKLERLVKSVCFSLKPNAMRKQLKLDCFIDPRLPQMILSDSVRLRQILYNLLANAIKFTSGRGGLRPNYGAGRVVR